MALYATYKLGRVESKTTGMENDALWILSIGGVGIGVGLLLYGYKIMRAIGVKLAVITPSRGTSIELGATMVIIFGSYLGLPLSTTHCKVAALLPPDHSPPSTHIVWRDCGGLPCIEFSKTKRILLLPTQHTRAHTKHTTQTTRLHTKCQKTHMTFTPQLRDLRGGGEGRGGAKMFTSRRKWNLEQAHRKWNLE